MHHNYAQILVFFLFLNADLIKKPVFMNVCKVLRKMKKYKKTLKIQHFHM